MILAQPVLPSGDIVARAGEEFAVPVAADHGSGAPTTGTESPDMSSKVVKKIAIIVGVVALVVGYKVYKKQEHGAENKEILHGWIEKMPGYEENQEYIDSIFEDAHEVAFDKSYDMGSRRRGASFDHDAYARVAFSSMRDQANKDERPVLAEAIHLIWKLHELTPAEGDADTDAEGEPEERAED